MVPITMAVSAADDSGVPACWITDVLSNESVNGPGAGHTAPDWEITGGLTVNLRAERTGSGPGRVYTVNVACSDAFDNLSTATATVNVPRSQGR
jgi:hypothetical protein